jgi:hypothetical protein
MSLETPLQRLIRWLNVGCLTHIVLPPLINLVIWLQWESWGRDVIVHRAGLHATDPSQTPQSFSLLQLLLGISVAAGPVGILVLGLMHLRRLFGAFAKDFMFTADNAPAIRISAWCIVAIQVVGFFTLGVEFTIITMNNLPGERALVLNSNQVIFIFVGLVFVVIAHALEEGYRLADDSASII